MSHHQRRTALRPGLMAVLAAAGALLATAAASAAPLQYSLTVLTGPVPTDLDRSINDSGQRARGNFGEATRIDPVTGTLGLGDLPGGPFASYGTGINNAGDVVGYSQSGNGQEAFLWTEAGGMQGLGDLPGGIFYSIAYAINNVGQVVGSSSGANGREAFLWDAATGMRGLGDLPGGGFSSFAYDINDDGSVVGESRGLNGTNAFLWTPATGMLSLTDLVADMNGFADLTIGFGINNAGQIWAVARSASGAQSNVLLSPIVDTTPVPLPGALLLMPAGLALIVAAKRRRIATAG